MDQLKRIYFLDFPKNPMGVLFWGSTFCFLLISGGTLFLRISFGGPSYRKASWPKAPQPRGNLKNAAKMRDRTHLDLCATVGLEGWEVYIFLELAEEIVVDHQRGASLHGRVSHFSLLGCRLTQAGGPHFLRRHKCHLWLSPQQPPDRLWSVD